LNWADFLVAGSSQAGVELFVMHPHRGYSRSARKRRKRAAVLSQRMRDGDSEAAFRLRQRQRALRGIKKHGWDWRLAKANAARLGKGQHQVQAPGVVARGQRQESQSEARFSAGERAVWRARYGQGVFSTDYREGQCQPVAPGGECPVCGWRRGSREPHPIAIR
jgi:hypothetical protein